VTPPANLAPYGAARIGRQMIGRHMRTLRTTPEPNLPAEVCMLQMPFELTGLSTGRTVRSTWHLREEEIAGARATASRMGVTLNALFLGELAIALFERCGQQRFAIAQTYLGRRADELGAVGSFSTTRPLVFDWTGTPSERAVCQQVMKETQRVMALDAIEQSTQPVTIGWELNDVRPMTRPAEVRQEAVPFVMASVQIYFMVNQYADGYDVHVVFGEGRFDSRLLHAFVDVWRAKLL